MRRVTVTFEFNTLKQEKLFKARIFELAQNMKAKIKKYKSKGIRNGNSGVFNSNVGVALRSHKSVWILSD